VCELWQSKAISITLHMARGRQTSCWGKMKAEFLNDLRVPWRHKRREMMAIEEIIPVAKWLAKIKNRSDVSCRLCTRAREQGGASTENLSEETYGHNNSAFCDVMATSVRLPTTSSRDICMPACKLHKHQRVSSGFSNLMKRVVWTRRGRKMSLSRYAVENRSRKRQQTWKKRSLWKSTEVTLWFRPDNV